MNKQNYQTLIEGIDWSYCNKKYYDSLTYIELFDNLTFLLKNRIAGKQTQDFENCNIGYFYAGQLVRIETVEKGISQEDTFLIWENDKPRNVYSFNLGYLFGRPVNGGIQLSDSWEYNYIDNKPIKIRWASFKNEHLNDKSDLYIDLKYEYDVEGLKFIYSSIVADKNSVGSDNIVYDREKEKFLKTCTITNVPLTERKSNKSDHVIDFTTNQTKVAFCQSCGKSMTHILSVNLNDKRINTYKIDLESIPVLHCFECLESQNYKPSNLNALPVTKNPFTEQKFIFKRETDEENEKNALFKIGGQPNWIHNAEHPVCSCCNSQMKFIAEINTDENMTNGNALLAFGDSGKLYVFACCDNVSCIPQWY